MRVRGRSTVSVIAWALALGLILSHALDIPHALLLAGLVTALTVVWPSDDAASPELPKVPLPSRPGGRRDLSELSWSLIDRVGRANPRTMKRIGALAAEAGLDDLSRDIAARPTASLRQLHRWLDAIAEQPARPDPGRPRTGQPPDDRLDTARSSCGPVPDSPSDSQPPRASRTPANRGEP